MTGGPKVASYTPADLSIGAVLNVYGRKVVLTDCDPYTKEYYRTTYGFGNSYLFSSYFTILIYLF